MINRKRTLEILGYDFDPDQKRRTKEQIKLQPNVIKKSQLLVVDNCPICNKERIIKYRASKKNKPCPKCFHNSDKMRKIKRQPKPPVTDTTKQKMRDNHWSIKGIESPFKGRKHTREAKRKLRQHYYDQFSKYTEDQKMDFKIKASCKLRAIPIDENQFDGFISSKNSRLRGLSEYKKWEKTVRERDCICQYPGCNKSINTVVHHLDGFSWCILRRHDTSNGVLLCREHHREFHRQYGTHNNTEKQYIEWINQNTKGQPCTLITGDTMKPVLYIVCGVSGSGKSWACNKLKDKYHYVAYDKVRKKDHLDMLLSLKGKPLLYDPTIKVSTFIKRNSDKFDIRLVTILGDFLQVKQQLINRGGKITKTIYRRWKRMTNYAHTRSIYHGSSQDVFKFLNSLY